MISSRQAAVLGKNYISPARPETQKSPRSRPPGAIIDAVERQGIVETSVQALQSFLGYVSRKRDDFKQVASCTWQELYITSPPRTQKSPRSRPPGAIIDAVDGQVILQTSVQALESLQGYVQR